MLPSLLFLLPPLFSLAFLISSVGYSGFLSLNISPLILVLMWFLGAEIVLIARGGSREGRTSLLRRLVIALSLCCLAFSLVQLSPRIPTFQFGLCAIYLALRFSLLRLSATPWLQFCISGVAAWTSGLLAYSVATQSLEWQTAVLLLGYAGIIASSALFLLEGASPKTEHFERAIQLGIVLGPLSCSFLVFLNQLPPTYLLTLVLALAAAPLSKQARRSCPPLRFGAFTLAATFGAVLCALRACYEL